ncbi:hypothetical protein, partial [Paenibacillus sp. GCM10027626]|uniref:hypothetical protein n=1 Tax=Paenibacillus sp. GCM10027626 TaxID=3273411 RepID=UPI0036376936
HENERIGEEMKENPSFHGENEGIRIMRFIAQGKLGRINRRSPVDRYLMRNSTISQEKVQLRSLKSVRFQKEVLLVK